MTLYLDTSVFVALLTDDLFTARAESYFRDNTESIIVSDFGAVEYASVLARRVRTRVITREEARESFSAFDVWRTRTSQRAEINTSDLALAEAWLRRLDIALRTFDAVHLAIAQRLGATLVTFDRQMAASARALGTPVETP